MSNTLSMFRRQRLSTIDACGALVMIGLSVMVFVGVVEPTRLHNRHTSATMQASARERQRLAGANTLGRALKLQIQTMSAQLQHSPVKIYPPEALNRRLVKVAALAAASGLTVNELKPRASERSDRFVLVPIRLAGRGSYPSCTEFLHTLHDNAGDFTVCAFRLSGSPESANTVGEFTIELRWIASATAQTAPVNEMAVTDIQP